jgi:UDP-glucose 4-epimerase
MLRMELSLFILNNFFIFTYSCAHFYNQISIVNMKKVILTGATGFIGGYLTKRLIERNYKVYAVVRNSSDTSFLDGMEVEYISMDFNQPESIAKQIDEIQADYFINNAGLTRSVSEDALNKVNAHFIENIAKAIQLSSNKPRVLLQVSSLAAFGPAEQQPNGFVSNESTPKPVTMYGRSKLLGEQLLKQHSDVPYIIVRPTAVYGPREKDLLTAFKALNKGFEIYLGSSDQRLTFIYVSDLVELIILAMEKGKRHEEYFFTDGKVYSTREFNQYIKEALGRKTIGFTLPGGVVRALGFVVEKLAGIAGKYPVLNKDKVAELSAKSWECDAQSAHNAFGFTPKYDLKSGVQETVDWYREIRWL